MADVKNNDRKDRLSAALRENLKRRKQQLRGRAGQPAGSSDGDAEPRDIAGDPAGKTSRDDRD
jgi:hypothetical protein